MSLPNRLPNPSASLIGSALAWLFLALWQTLARNPDVTPLFVISVDASLVLIAATGATLVGTLAAFIPARRAALTRWQRSVAKEELVLSAQSADPGLHCAGECHDAAADRTRPPR